MTSWDAELEEAAKRTLQERCGEELRLNEMKPATKCSERSRRSTERRKMYRASMQQKKIAAATSESKLSISLKNKQNFLLKILMKLIH